jgi:hypothetical protein
VLSSVVDGGLGAAGAEEELGDLLQGRQCPVRNWGGAALVAVLAGVVPVVTCVVFVGGVTFVRHGLVVALVFLMDVVVAAGRRRRVRMVMSARPLGGHWIVGAVARGSKAAVQMGHGGVVVMRLDVLRADVLRGHVLPGVFVD